MSPGTTRPQQVPRPDGWLPGAGAPWARAWASRPVPRSVRLADVRAGLAAEPLPGLARGQGVARHVTPLELPALLDARPAGVLCLLFGREGEANVVLTRRAAHLPAHAGEVSFPGGRLREGEQPLQAALREAHEEIGVLVPESAVLGELTPLTTARSPALVYCYVATFDGPGEGCELRPQVSEVERVFWAPLAQLAEEGVFHEELWPPADGSGEGYRAVPFFTLEEDVVWGATGRMLAELLTRALVGPRPAPATER